MDFGGLFGAAGSIISAGLQSSAVDSATRAQQNALAQIRQNVEGQLSPDTINSVALAGDTQRAQQQQALLAKIYPGLFQAENLAQNSLAQQASGFGANAPATQVAAEATKEALSGPSTEQGRQQLIDSALAQLKAGATLPPDVEAQLVQSGLESSGMVTQNASGRGIGGQQLRTILGTAGIELQRQRQAQAAGLLTQAQQLETQRQQVLQGLFPSLADTQLKQVQGAAGIFGTAANATPQAGLSGTSLANAWLQRVGALNQVIGQAGGVSAAKDLAKGQIWGNAIGSAVSGLGSLNLGGGQPGGGGGGVGNQSSYLNFFGTK